MIRPSWHEYFMEIAEVTAKRATCHRKHVGAVIVNDRHIISTGYNGSPPGLPHCTSVGHQLKLVNGKSSCIRTVHAEINAIAAAAKLGNSTKDSVMYITMQPCYTCTKALLSAGIKAVYWQEDYPDDEGLELLKSSGIIFQKLHTQKTRELTSAVYRHFRNGKTYTVLCPYAIEVAEVSSGAEHLFNVTNEKTKQLTRFYREPHGTYVLLTD